jgi:hypothetical protein
MKELEEMIPIFFCRGRGRDWGYGALCIIDE